MCIGGNNSPPPKEVEKPVFIRNPYLDERDPSRPGSGARVDRAQLAIPLETGIGFEGRGGTGSATDGGTPMGNSRPPRRSGAALPVVASPITPAPIPPRPPRTITPGNRQELIDEVVHNPRSR